MARTWRALIVPTGVPTDDGRIFEEGSLSWRELPLTLMGLLDTPDWGHTGAQVVGRIDELHLDGANLMGAGVLHDDHDDPEIARLASTVASLIEDGTVRGISADTAIIGAEIEPVDPEDIEGAWQMRITEAVLVGATVVPMPAFRDAVIELTGSSDDSGDEAPTEEEAAAALIAAAANRPTLPPAAWFADPELAGPTPLTVTDEGRVYGHLALWNSCHTAYDRCVSPPREEDFAYFRLGGVLTAEGVEIAVGTLSMNTGHAPLGTGRIDATAHYDDTGTAAAYVAAGADEYGPWVAGVIAPGLEEDDVARLRAGTISGDWRRVDGRLRLVAALVVNVPGFPVPRVGERLVASLTASGAGDLEPAALVASGVVIRDQLAEGMKPLVGRVRYSGAMRAMRERVRAA